MTNEIARLNTNVPATRNPNALPAPAKAERLMAKMRGIRFPDLHLAYFADPQGEQAQLAAADAVLRDLEPIKPHLDALLTPATKGDVLRFVATLVDYWSHSKAGESYLEATCEDVGAKQPLAASLDETFRRLRRDPKQIFLPNSGQIFIVLAGAERDIRVAAETYDRIADGRARFVREIEERAEIEAERERREKASAEAMRLAGPDDIPF
jgi:hypothetical protein